MDAQQTLDALLATNQNHDKLSGPQENNHVPIMLIALYRMGGSPAQMPRHLSRFDMNSTTQKIDDLEFKPITIENWIERLGNRAFSSHLEFFDAWTRQESVDTVLRQAVSILMRG